MTHFLRRSAMPASAAALFRWHERPGAFERLTPPWERVEVLQAPGSLADGSRAVLRVRLGPFRKRWVAEHRGYRPDEGFEDVQVEGPFARWHHRHRMLPDSPTTSTLEDDIDYALPLGWLGRLAAGRSTRRKLERMFRYRHETTARDLAAHGAYGPARPLRIVLSGASGFLGNALVPFLTTGGHDVVVLGRGEGDGPTWDPRAGRLDPALLEGADAVVHLGGASIAGGRWNERRKRMILESRTQSTELMARTLAGLDKPPSVFVCASAVGFYGTRGEDPIDEGAAPGEGFLAEVVRAWEAACGPARAAGLRVVNLRFGVVLGAAGGALKSMLTPFRLCVGGRLGSGRQGVSWVGLDDAVAAVLHALRCTDLAGPVNVTAPRPVDNRELTRVLARVLRRPALMPAPAFALRLLLGEMGQALLLEGSRVLPRRLVDTGFAFRHPHLEACLRHALGRAETS